MNKITWPMMKLFFTSNHYLMLSVVHRDSGRSVRTSVGRGLCWSAPALDQRHCMTFYLVITCSTISIQGNYINLLLNLLRFQGSTVGVLAGIFMTSWINIGQLIHYPHRSYLDTNVGNCTHLGNATATPIEEDK